MKGAELEATYEPVPGLKFSFAGGYEDARLADGSKAVDLMDRTAGHAGWMVVKPIFIATSNCILPDEVVAELVAAGIANTANTTGGALYINSLQFGACEEAYSRGEDPAHPTTGVSPPSNLPITGFDPSTAPNNGEGFDKDLSGNRLPSAPPFTASLAGDYTIPITPEWTSTLHVDYYWQDYSWARVYNDNPYDRLRGYTNVNLALILTSQNGWQVMGYVKNVFDATDITGAFLNSDDTALTTNVFVTDPRLFGVRVTKNW